MHFSCYNASMNLPHIPYFQTTRYRVQTMIDLAHILPGETATDLGSGDGRIVIALAKAGAHAVGYELEEQLAKLSEENITKELSLFNPPKQLGTAHILQKDFWTEDLSRYSIITVYPMPDIMEALEKKLINELKHGSRVLLNYYPFPHWKEATKKDNIYLYIKS